MSRLNLFWLGSPKVEFEGSPIKLDTSKAIALLAYLVVTCESQRRDSLVTLLWPDYGQSRGRAVLRQTLHVLKKAFSGNWLEASRDNVSLRPGVDIWVDVNQFRRYLEECRAHDHPEAKACPQCLIPLTKAAGLYRDDFLKGFSLKDSINFDDWQFSETENLRLEQASVLERLVKCYSAQGEFETAIRTARRCLALDPLHESVHRWLMQLYVWAGQRSAALRQYSECKRILSREVDASPSEETTQLFSLIKEGSAPQPPSYPDVMPKKKKAGSGSLRTKKGTRTSSVQSSESNREEELPADEASAAIEKQCIATVLFLTATNLVLDEYEVVENSLASRFFKVVNNSLRKYGGHVDRFLGESVLASFGRSHIHESDPEVAIRSSIEIRREAKKTGLSVKVGIDTGIAYFGRIDSDRDHEITVSGQAVNLAMRLCGKAGPGQILVGESTYRLTRGAFAFSPIRIELARINRSLTAYKLGHLLSQPKKTRGIEGLYVELVGREKELSKLEEVVERVMQGQGQIVTLIGEAGVGKSRLVTELKSRITSIDLYWLEGRCLEVGVSASYWPFIDIFREHFALGAEDDSRMRGKTIAASLEELMQRGDLPADRVEEIGIVLGRILSASFDSEWDMKLKGVDPEQIKILTFLAIRDYFVALAQMQPVVLVIEDLHWADSMSIDLISLLMESLPLAPLALLCVYRPEKKHKCSHLAAIASQKCSEWYTDLLLRELTPEQCRQMVESLLKTRDVPSVLRGLILEKSQGNPFFVEEVIRSFIDSGRLCRENGIWRLREGVDPIIIQESLQSVILGRVDKLKDDLMPILQIASVIGRLFRRSVLEHVAGNSGNLESALWELEDRALIYEERAIPEEEYSFKHVLTQEAIYESIPEPRRKELHMRVAEAIEDLYQESLYGHYEQLAFHYGKSAKAQKAVEYLFKAGDKARKNYSNSDCIDFLTRGLAVLRTLPETAERNRRELDFQIAIGIPLLTTKGSASPEVGRAYTRARELSDSVGESSELFQALLGLRRYHFIRGELNKAYDHGNQLLNLANVAKDSILLSKAYMVQGSNIFWLGDFARSREHLEKGIAMYDDRDPHYQELLFGGDTLSFCRQYLALTLWHLGFPERSVSVMNQASVQARSISHPFGVAGTIFSAACLYQLRREIQAVQVHAEALIQLSSEHQFALFLAAGSIWLGWSMAEQGRLAEGIAQILQGISCYRETDARVPGAYFQGLLAEAYGKSGQNKKGLTTLDKALAEMEKTGERWYESELYRLKGELLKSQGKADDEAIAYIRRALAVAGARQAKLLELRTIVSLNRLCQKEGSKEEARELLGQSYGWFTEGFETVDLKEARLLLDSLGDRIA